MADELCALHFHDWSQTRAEVLRSRGRGANALDDDRLTDEVGDMGQTQRAAPDSLCIQVLEHLIKLEFSQREEPKAHWGTEIVAFRKGWKRTLTLTIRPTQGP